MSCFFDGGELLPGDEAAGFESLAWFEAPSAVLSFEPEAVEIGAGSVSHAVEGSVATADVLFPFPCSSPLAAAAAEEGADVVDRLASIKTCSPNR